MTAEQVQHARGLLTRPYNTVSSIARLLGVSPATIYKYVPELPARPRRPERYQRGEIDQRPGGGPSGEDPPPFGQDP
jgi:hypothetical protein